MTKMEKLTTELQRFEILINKINTVLDNRDYRVNPPAFYLGEIRGILEYHEKRPVEERGIL